MADMSGAATKVVSVVVPCFNEEEVIEAFYDRICGVAGRLSDYRFEFLFVDDGSADRTAEILAALAASDERVVVLTLSTNFGHQNAITSGLDHCRGDFVVILDADLQDPPECIPEIVDALESGYDLVHMVRADRQTDTWLKRATARAFYWVMRRFVLPELPVNAGDYKGFNRKVLQAIGQYREQVRFLRGLLASLGFRQTEIPYARDVRYAGVSKYPWRKVLRFGFDALLSFSNLPLRLCLFSGVFCLVATTLLLIGLVVAAFFDRPIPLLPATLAVLTGYFSGMVLTGLGVVGEYMSRIFIEMKGRPLYHVSSEINHSSSRVPMAAPHRTNESRNAP